jgi:hypothetical protein
MRLTFAARTLLTHCALSIAAVYGACNSHVDDVCQEYSGECTKSVQSVVGGSPRDAHAVLSLLQYGRFCGAGSNKCPGQNNGVAKGLDALEACPGLPEELNPIDEACKFHDECLDHAGNNPGSEPVLTLEGRCLCDATFVAQLFSSLISPDRELLPPLCDEEYYDVANDPPNPDEEVILAATFCCLLSSGGCDTLVEAAILLPAQSFCGFISVQLLELLGVDVCSL